MDKWFETIALFYSWLSTGSWCYSNWDCDRLQEVQMKWNKWNKGYDKVVNNLIYPAKDKEIFFKKCLKP